MEKTWLKAYPRGVRPSIDFEDISMPDALMRSARRFPDNAGLMFHGTTITFKEFDDMVSRFAAGLRKLGVGKDNYVCIVLPNLVQTAVAIYGAMRAGAIAVPLSPLESDVEFQRRFNLLGTKHLVCLDTLVPRMIQSRKRTPVKTIISCHIRDYLPSVKKTLFPWLKGDLHLKTPEGENLYEFVDIVKDNEPLKDWHTPDMDDVAVVLYTTGTTGLPKGVQLTHRNLSYNCQQGKEWAASMRDGQEISLACLPFFHSYGLTCSLNMPVFCGWSTVLMPKPDAGQVLEDVKKYRITSLCGVPTLFNAMINHPKFRDYDLTSLRNCMSGAWPLPTETLNIFLDSFGVSIIEAYGLTETSPCAISTPFTGKGKPGSIGVPLPSTDAKIVDINDPDQEITEPGVAGELCIKGPQVMKGYIHQSDETSSALRDGWLLTGDIVTRDSEGYFHIVDRKKDMILSGGVPVYPREIDEVLYKHPKVKEAAAIGIPHERHGELVKVFVVPTNKSQVNRQEILAHCKKWLNREAVPEDIEFVEDLPKTIVGKILRRELRRLELLKRRRTATA